VRLKHLYGVTAAVINPHAPSGYGRFVGCNCQLCDSNLRTDLAHCGTCREPERRAARLAAGRLGTGGESLIRPGCSFTCQPRAQRLIVVLQQQPGDENYTKIQARRHEPQL